MNWEVDMLVKHWSMRVSQNFNQGPKKVQHCATLWVMPPDEVPSPDYLRMRAKQVDYQMLDIFGSVDRDREWALMSTIEMPLYKDTDAEQ